MVETKEKTIQTGWTWDDVLNETINKKEEKKITRSTPLQPHPAMYPSYINIKQKYKYKDGYRK